MLQTNHGSKWAKSLLVLSLGGLFSSPVLAQSVCGTYTPTVYISPTADLGEIGTATYGSPGSANLFPLDEYLIFNDVWGNRALKNCQPVRSITPNDQGDEKQNFYRPSGNLDRQTTVLSNGSPASQQYGYTLLNGSERLTSAQYLCTRDNPNQFYYVVQTYNANNRLSAWYLYPDAQCYDQTATTVTYEYNDARAPGMPTRITTTTRYQGGTQYVKDALLSYIINANQIDRVDMTFTTDYGYFLLQGLRYARLRLPLPYLLQQIPRFNGRSTDSYTGYWQFAHNNGLLTGMRYHQSESLGGASGSDQLFAVSYTANNKLAGITQPGFGWGLIVGYNTDLTQVISTKNNTGFPQAPTYEFFY